MLSLLAAIVALSLLIVIHEFGHFACAKLAGMHVDRFSVFGIGKPILRLGTYRGTEYVVSLIPFGAYVHIVGMEAHEDEPTRAGSVAAGVVNFRDAGVFARMSAILGGPMANYAAAMLIMIGVLAVQGTQQLKAVAIGGFADGSPAQTAGLREGDVFVDIAGTALNGPTAAADLHAVIGRHLGETVEVVIDRRGESLTFQVRLNEQAPALQTQLSPVGEWTPMPIRQAVVAGILWPLARTRENLDGLAAMITGKQAGSLTGPVGIVDQMRQSAAGGWIDFLVFAALISTVLGMTNLLPLPALDGGRMVFLLYEAVTRRPFNRRLEQGIHGVGMVCLLALLAVVTIQDVAQRVMGG
jgi:regulator of sigma E protease